MQRFHPKIFILSLFSLSFYCLVASLPIDTTNGTIALQSSLNITNQSQLDTPISEPSTPNLTQAESSNSMDIAPIAPNSSYSTASSPLSAVTTLATIATPVASTPMSTQLGAISRIQEDPPKETILIAVLIALLMGIFMLIAALFGLLALRRTQSHRSHFKKSSSDMKVIIKPWDHDDFCQDMNRGFQYHSDWQRQTCSLTKPDQTLSRAVMQKCQRARDKFRDGQFFFTRESHSPGLSKFNSRATTKLGASPRAKLSLSFDKLGIPRRTKTKPTTPPQPPKDPKVISKLPVRIYESLELLPQQLIGRTPSTLKSVKH